VSIRQFSDGDLGAEVLSLLQLHQLTPDVLHIEVTESLIAQREVELSRTLHRLSELGLRLHLDDFGTGYSSLSRLQQLPLHTLKIDRSFVTPLSEGNTVMVHTIVEMARSLGLQVIAEGVETLGQYELLCQLNVDFMQGYLFAKPMPEAELLVWLEQQPLAQASC
jgi:EAL domain-containing protein (putative c-di-GMP-specific phosphodiesterase class I)